MVVCLLVFILTNYARVKTDRGVPFTISPLRVSFHVVWPPSFDGLIAYRDGKFVIPDLDEFFAKVREEYPKRSDWTQMKKSMKASGWDWSRSVPRPTPSSR